MTNPGRSQRSTPRPLATSRFFAIASSFAGTPAIVIAFGVLFVLYLLSTVPAGAFYSGDAGLKALLVKQYCRGVFTDALQLPAEPWVQQAWDDGLYPFGPPFVYKLPRGQVVAFPLLFPIITAPFYKLLGPVGLYVVPAVSLWLLWIRFAYLARRLGFSTSVTTSILVVLVFASPLTLYGAMFWEHTLAALLVFCGLDFLLLAHQRPPGRLAPAAWGVLTGLAAWIRPEAYCMLAGFVVFVAYSWLRRTTGRSRELQPARPSPGPSAPNGLVAPDGHGKTLRSLRFFVLGLVTSVLALWAANTILYGHPLGLHSAQVLDQPELPWRPQDHIDLAFGLLLYLPILVFVVLVLLARRSLRLPTLPSFARHIALLCAACLLVVPFILPNTGGKQWGPRYLLIIVPPLCLLAGSVAAASAVQSSRVRRALAAVLAVCTLLGVYTNTFVGASQLVLDYRDRVKPALDLILRNDRTCMAVNTQKGY